MCKGLNFSVKPKSIEYSEFLLPFELLFRDVKQENFSSEGLSIMKARLLDTALSSHESFSSDRNPSENKKGNKSKADKGKTIVILGKISYITTIDENLK